MVKVLFIRPCHVPPCLINGEGGSRILESSAAQRHFPSTLSVQKLMYTTCMKKLQKLKSSEQEGRTEKNQTPVLFAKNKRKSEDKR